MRRWGSDVTVVTWLSMVATVEEAADELAADGVDVEVTTPGPWCRSTERPW